MTFPLQRVCAVIGLGLAILIFGQPLPLLSGGFALAQGFSVDTATPYGDISPEEQRKLRRQYGDVARLLGSGYNGFNHAVLNPKCVIGKYDSVENPTTAETRSYRLINSIEEFQRETAVEAHVNASFGAFAADMSSRYSTSEKSSSHRSFLLIKVRVAVSPPMTIAEEELSSEAKERLARSTPAAFYDECGDNYVSGVVMGGEFIALLAFEESSKQLSSDLDVKASASYAASSASVDFNQRLNSLRGSSSLEVNMTRIGGNAEVPAFAKGDEGINILLDYVTKFSHSVEDGKAAPIGVNVTPYYNERLLDLSSARDIHQAMLDKLAEVDAAITKLNVIEQGLEKFNIPESIDQHPNIRDVAAEKRQYLATWKRHLEQQLTACERQYYLGACVNSRSFVLAGTPGSPRTIPELPILKFQVVDAKGTPSDWVAPKAMKVVLRGRYCWDDGNRDCNKGINGVTNNNDAYVTVMGRIYGGGEVSVPPGPVRIKAQDTDYSDNFNYNESEKTGLWAVYFSP